MLGKLNNDEKLMRLAVEIGKIDVNNISLELSYVKEVTEYGMEIYKATWNLQRMLLNI